MTIASKSIPSTIAIDFLRSHERDASQFAVVEQVAMRTSAVGHGLVAQSLERLVSAERLFDFCPVDSKEMRMKERWGIEDAQIVHSNDEEGVWKVDLTDIHVIASHNTLSQNTSRILFADARQESALVLMRTSRCELLLQFSQNELTILSVPNDADGAEGSTVFVRGRAAATMPALDGLLGPVPQDPWMVQRFALAEHGGTYQRVAAVASVARLWSTSATRDKGLSVEQMLREARAPLDRARAWYASLPEDNKTLLMGSALAEIDQLHLGLENLIEQTVQDQDKAAQYGLSWIERRDDLESVFVLVRTDVQGMHTQRATSVDGSTLRHALEALDTTGESLVSTWAELSMAPSPMLVASADEEPHQWWTAVLR